MRKFSFAVLVLLQIQSATSQEFRGLGDLPSGKVRSFAYDMSASGNVIVGKAGALNGDEGFVWTLRDGLQSLFEGYSNDLPECATVISADGSTIFGVLRDPLRRKVFYWNRSLGVQALPVPEDADSIALLSLTESPDIAYGVKVQRETGSLALLTWTVHDNSSIVQESEELNVDSHDALVSILDIKGNKYDVDQFDVVKPPGILLPDRCDGFRIRKISSDGTVIVGDRDKGGRVIPLLWKTSTGCIELEDAQGNAIEVSALDFTRNGDVVVGFGASPQGEVAMIWTEQTGFVDLAERLSFLSVVPEGWALTRVTAVSADGNTFSGWGINQSGYPEAWWMRIPNARFWLRNTRTEIAHVNFGYSGEATGEKAKPYNDLLTALDSVAANSVLSISRGSLPGKFTIGKPVCLVAAEGPVRLGDVATPKSQPEN